MSGLLLVMLNSEDNNIALKKATCANHLEKQNNVFMQNNHRKYQCLRVSTRLNANDTILPCFHQQRSIEDVRQFEAVL